MNKRLMNNRCQIRLLAAGSAALLAAGCTGAVTKSGHGGVAAQDALHTPLSCAKTVTSDDLLAMKAPAAGKRYRITLMLVSLDGYYYQAVAYGARQAARQAGVDLSIVASQGFASAPLQLTQVHDVLNRGTDAILLQPADVNGSIAVVNAAVQAKVPVTAIGSLVQSDQANQIEQDDYMQGRQAAQALAKQLPGGGEGIVMGGPSNATWSLRRVAGFQDELKKHPNLKAKAVLNTQVDPGAGQRVFANAAGSHPKVDWIYTVYNVVLPPSSVPKQYQSAVYIGGAFEPATRDGMRAGSVAAVIPDWPVQMGYAGVSQVVAQLNGQRPPKLTCFPNVTLTRSDTDTPVANAQLYPPGYKAGS